MQFKKRMKPYVGCIELFVLFGCCLSVLLLPTRSLKAKNAIPVAGGTQARDRFVKARDFACYYGDPNVNKLSRFNTVIIEPSFYSKAMIDSLKKTSVTVGYISLGELAPQDKHLMDGRTGWAMDKDNNGSPDADKDWGSLYADPSSELWRNFIFQRADDILGAKGFDGLFLDTLDTVDLYPDAAKSMSELVLELRKRYPQKILIANRGFSIFNDISTAVDGVMFECFTTCYDSGKKKNSMLNVEDMLYNQQIYETHLAGFLKAGGVVLALDYALPSEKKLANAAWTRATDYGFIPGISRGELDTLDFVKGKYDKSVVSKYGVKALSRKLKQNNRDN